MGNVEKKFARLTWINISTNRRHNFTVDMFALLFYEPLNIPSSDKKSRLKAAKTINK